MAHNWPVLEFFAGGGMARLGLEGAGPFSIAMANDNDAAKCAIYRANFGAADLIEGDVWRLDIGQLVKASAGAPALAWASFPCQDLSLAGQGAGLGGARSSAFFGFWRAMEGLIERAAPPTVIVLENVLGFLTARNGDDFTTACAMLVEAGYHVGAVVLDAAHFVPQSRPRVFLIATQVAPPPDMTDTNSGPVSATRPPGVHTAHERLPDAVKRQWIWWRLPPLPQRNTTLTDILEPVPENAWRSETQTQALINQMAPLHLARLRQACEAQTHQVGAIFRRTRSENTVRRVRAEVRFDGVAGCLRTPAGGSSRQFVIVCSGQHVRTRPLTAREAARLMGLPESYQLPDKATAALHLTGDGVAPPVVRWLADALLNPLLAAARPTADAA